MRKKNKLNLNKILNDNNLKNLNLTDNNINSKIKIIPINIPNNIDSHSENISKLKNINNKKESKKKKNYTDNEINSSDFKEAIKIDKRTYWEYYRNRPNNSPVSIILHSKF